MKRLIRHIALATALLLAACTEGPAETPGEGGGAATFTIAAVQSRADAEAAGEEEYPWNRCAIRIYKHTDEGGKELIRRYNRRSEMPASLWLIEGDYSIAVEAGSKAEASFEEPTYRGEAGFRIVDGRTTAVEVECRIVNTMVRVVCDATIASTFKESYATEVVFGDPADTKAPRLTYGRETGDTGYFILPEEPVTLNWTFRGKGEKNGVPLELEKSGSQEVTPQPGVRYELKLKYSKDLGGALDFTLTLDENPDEVDDPIVFVPNPQIAGDEFDIAEVQEYLAGSKSYRISSIADMAEIAIEAAGSTFRVPATGAYPEDADGISLEYDNPADMRLTLGPAFFAKLPAGEHTLTLTATDADGGEGKKTARVKMLQGAWALASTDCWNAKGRMEAWVCDPAAHDVKIRYRKAGAADWSVADAAPSETGTYAAEGSGIEADTEYEYQLLFGEEPVNGIARTTIGSGPQIPNSGFEQWSNDSDKALIPAPSTSDQWWDTGNHGSITLNTNVTTHANDPRPGSAGTTSAKLQSQKVALMGIGKFAAGNLFVGKYLKTDGTDGILAFGRYFDFTYRPKALRFWYKGSVGTIDERGGNTPDDIQKGQSDVSTVYLCLCTMGDEKSSHVTQTKQVNTLFTPAFPETGKTIDYSSDYKNNHNNDGVGNVIAYAIWEQKRKEGDNTTQYPDWTEIEVPLTYYPQHEGTRPTHLLLIASASKYGDYFTGSTESVMYLDDLELVY